MSAVLARLLLFFTPFILFLLWLWVMRHTRLGDGRIDPKTARRITRAGIALIVVTVVGFALYGLLGEGLRPEGPYVPAKAGEQGVEPGHFEEKRQDDDAPPP